MPHEYKIAPLYQTLQMIQYINLIRIQKYKNIKIAPPCLNPLVALFIGHTYIPVHMI